MKKSIENYNNIRISKRIKSANDDPPSLLTTTTTATESSTTTTSSADSLSSKKFIFKSKATNKTTTTTTIKTATTNITNLTKTDSNPKFKLKRSFDDDEDDDLFKTPNQSAARLNKSPNKSPNKTLNNDSSTPASRQLNEPVISETESQPSKAESSSGGMDVSSDSDLDDLMDPSDLNSNINSTKPNKFIKLIKTSKSSFSSTSPTQAAAESCSASASSQSSRPNQAKRKIFSSKRHNADSQPAFTINFNSKSLFVGESADCAANGNDNDHSDAEESSSSSESPHEDTLKARASAPRNSEALVVQLRNTRKAYECEELGETQAFFDDLFYLMHGLSAKYKLSQRCLCAVKLAEQCLSSEFRMSLRSSSDYLNKIFALLNDSNKYKVSFIFFFFLEFFDSVFKVNQKM
jgi:hypothetical protein